MAVLRHPPDPARPARPWLATVLRHLLRRQDRERRRREAREREVTALTPTAVAPPSEGLERLELQHLLAGLVLELEEPFRSTVVQRYLEGQTGAQIAREAGVPEGTVRWRLNEALKRLRRGMDQRTRASWPSIVLAGGKGITMKVTTKSGLAAAIALLLVLLGAVLSLRTRMASEGRPLSNASDVRSSGPHATSGAAAPDQVRQQSPASRRSPPPRFQSVVTTGEAAPRSPPGPPRPARQRRSRSNGGATSLPTNWPSWPKTASCECTCPACTPSTTFRWDG